MTVMEAAEIPVSIVTIAEIDKRCRLESELVNKAL